MPLNPKYVAKLARIVATNEQGAITTAAIEQAASIAKVQQGKVLQKKKGRTVVITTEDMQKRRNDVKARTTLLLALPDEHQLRFSKYETAKELWEAILKTFGGNEATKKIKKNQLKQQYGDFKAEGSETLEQTFNRLQAIVSHLEFMDVEIKQDDLNQKFLTSLAPEWLIGKGKVYTASVPTASTQVSTASTDVAAASLSHDTICLPEFVDDTVTDYSRPTPSIDTSKSNPSDLQSNNFFVSEHGESSGSIMSKPMIKNTTKTPKVRGNQRNWNNLKSQQLGKDFVMQNKACFKCGYFDHLASDCGETKEKLLRPQLVGFEDLNKILLNKGNINDKGYWDSGCSRHVTGNISYLSEYEPYDGGYVSFGQGGGKITGTSSTNISGTKDVASQAMKKDVSSLRYIALPNWFHEAHMETKNSDGCNADDPKSNISPESSSDLRIISKRDFSQKETPSFGNALTLSNELEDTFREGANLSNMETSIPVSPTSTFKIHKDDPKSQIIGPVDTPEEPKNIFDALKDLSWVEAMQEKLLQFKIQNVWILVDCPKGVRPIGTKWVLKNKKDERGIVIRNKARLVAQGYTQEERIDYEEVFAPVARIEAIRLFLAYVSFMGFIVYQMDVKNAFLYRTIDEEVYVMQPLGFQDPEFPDRVYKVENAMYGLHQAPKAWYGTLSKYLLDNGFQRSTIDQTLFIIKHKGEFLLVQVYVDDIIFGSSNPQLCREFEALMHEKF
nr:putative ribonuclease H-like domain-containing protein [Tanacetum cinerariifolium]